MDILKIGENALLKHMGVSPLAKLRYVLKKTFVIEEAKKVGVARPCNHHRAEHMQNEVMFRNWGDTRCDGPAHETDAFRPQCLAITNNNNASNCWQQQ